MANKILNTRLRLKYDTWANWTAQNPVLLKGEVGIVYIPEQTNETGKVTQKPATVFKVGDGTTPFNGLEFASGLAADVHSWAKKEKGEASDIIYKPAVKDTDGNVITDAILVDTAISSLEASVAALEEIFKEEGENGTVSGISGIIENYINTKLNKSDTAVTGQYVSAVSQENGIIKVTRAELPKDTLTEGTKNGTVNFNGADVNVHGLGSAAYKDESYFDLKDAGINAAAAVRGSSTDAAGTATVHGALNQGKVILGSEADTAKEKTVYGAFAAIKDVKDNVIGTKPADATSTTVYGYIDEAIAKVAGDDSVLAQQVEANTAAIGEAAAEGKEATGLIKATTDNAAAIAKNTAAIATLNGTVEEVGSVAKAIADAKTDIRGNVTADYDTLGKIESKIKGNAISVEVDADGTDTAIKTYTFYAGDKTETNKLVTIDIPKDLVVTSGTVGTVTEADKPYAGAQVGDAYIDLAIANQDEHIYIPAKNLVDVYTAATNATEVQLTVGADNVISAALVDGGITTAKIANEAVTYEKLSSTVQDSLDAADTAIQSIKTSNETDSNAKGTIVVDGVAIAVKGLASAAFADADSFASANILENLDANLKAADVTATEATDAINVVTGITQVDGQLTGIEATKLAKVASTASAYDLSQATKDINKVGETETEVDCFIFYGGSATELVKNYNA